MPRFGIKPVKFAVGGVAAGPNAAKVAATERSMAPNGYTDAYGNYWGPGGANPLPAPLQPWSGDPNYDPTAPPPATSGSGQTLAPPAAVNATNALRTGNSGGGGVGGGGTPVYGGGVPSGLPTPVGGRQPITYPTQPGGGYAPGGTAAPPPPVPQYNSFGAPGPVSSFPSLPGGYTAPAVSAPGTGGDSNLAQSLESDRELTQAQGQQLVNQFGQQGEQAQQKENYFQDQLASAYAPLLAGNGGYTPEQAAAIEANSGPYGLSTLDPNAMEKAYGTGAAAVNSALTSGDAATTGAIDPSKLQFGPQAQQDVITRAANQARTAGEAEKQNIENSAFAAGNVSPMAIAAAEDRANQTSELAAADATTNARLGAAQLGLSANQYLTNLEEQTAQENAQRDTGAQIQEQAAGVGAAQASQTEGLNLNQLSSGRAQTVAGANLQAGQEARNNYLGTQEQQANQTASTAGQQQISAYGTEASGTNAGAAQQIANKSVNQQNPGTVTNILGVKDGATVEGPIMAEVGEGRDPHSPTGYAPEAIVPIGPPKHMAFGGMIRPVRPTGPPKPVAPRMFSTGRQNFGIPQSSLYRTMTNSGFNRIIPKFDDGGTVDPNAGLTDQDVGWGPTWYQKAAAIAAAMNPRIGGLLGAIPGATWNDPNNPDTRPEWQKAIQAISPRAGSVAAAATGKTAPPANPAGDRQNANFQNTILPSIYNYKPPEEPRDEVIAGGGGSRRKMPSLPKPPGTPPARPSPPSVPVAGTPPVSAPPITPPTTPPTGPPAKPKEPIGVGRAGDPVWGPIVPDPDPVGPIGTPPPINVPDKTPLPPVVGVGKAGDPVWGPVVPDPGGNPGEPGTGSSGDPNQGPISIDYGPGPAGGGTGEPPVVPGGPGTGGVGDYPLPPGAGGEPLPPVDSGGGGTPSNGAPPPGDTNPSPQPPDNSEVYSADNPIYGGGQYGSAAGANPFQQGGDIFAGSYARGGVFRPPLPVPQSPYGPTKVVDRPTLMPLGTDQPQAVVPLTSRPGARIKPRDIPRLIRKNAQKQPNA